MPPITKWIHRNDAKIEAPEKKLDIVVPDNTKAIINFIGIIFLIGLMILVTIKDVFKFIV